MRFDLRSGAGLSELKWWGRGTLKMEKVLVEVISCSSSSNVFIFKVQQDILC